MRIVFMGSPEFALPALSRLIESEHDVVASYTQPDRPSGRGRKLTPPPVKTLALAHGLDVRQPKSISKPDVVEDLRRLAPDVGVIPVSDSRLEFPIGAGVRRRDADLATAVDSALGRLREQGKVQEILTRYGAVGRPSARRQRGWVVLAQAKDPVEVGRSLFSLTCSRCHGAEGVGGGQGGALPPIKNYQAGEGKFVRIVQNGRPGTPMAPFKGILTPEEIQSIYRFLTSPAQR